MPIIKIPDIIIKEKGIDYRYNKLLKTFLILHKFIPNEISLTIDFQKDEYEGVYETELSQYSAKPNNWFFAAHINSTFYTSNYHIFVIAKEAYKRFYKT